jgi:endonuclease-3 related protein
LKVSKSFPEPEVNKIYKLLYNYYGTQNWWPADSEFEVIVGAVLTQNTSWRNVEKVITNLKKKKLLHAKRLEQLSVSELGKLIRSSGFYRVKSRRLKAMVDFLIHRYSGRIDNLKKQALSVLRLELLNIYGIGEETADSILLYALDKPVFVVDAYTKRIFSRHGYFNPDEPYTTIQEFFSRNLPKSVKIYNEYHALLVRLAKDYCQKKPLCSTCPINGM